MELIILGLVVYALIVTKLWRTERKRRQEAEAMLRTPLRDLQTRRRDE